MEPDRTLPRGQRCGSVKAYRSLNQLADGSEFGPWLDRLRSAPHRSRVSWDDAAVSPALLGLIAYWLADRLH